MKRAHASGQLKPSRAAKLRRVEKEIAQHGKTWCFSPESYKSARMQYDRSPLQVQGDYDLCHAFR